MPGKVSRLFLLLGAITAATWERPALAQNRIESWQYGSTRCMVFYRSGGADRSIIQGGGAYSTQEFNPSDARWTESGCAKGPNARGPTDAEFNEALDRLKKWNEEPTPSCAERQAKWAKMTPQQLRDVNAYLDLYQQQRPDKWDGCRPK